MGEIDYLLGSQIGNGMVIVLFKGIGGGGQARELGLRSCSESAEDWVQQACRQQRQNKTLVQSGE